MQVDGDVIEAGSKVVLAERSLSKVKVSDTVMLRQQFCRDELTGTIRSQLRYYCLDVDQSTSDTACIYVLYVTTTELAYTISALTLLVR